MVRLCLVKNLAVCRKLRTIMGLLDNDEQVTSNAHNHIKETICQNLYWEFIIGGSGATGIEVESNSFVTEMQDSIDNAGAALVKRMQQHAGREIYRLDCSKLCKYDAIGWLRKVSQLPLSPKPILVIENITEMPHEDEVHDTPKYIENLLVHSWKNPTNQFTDNRSGQNHEQFTINPRDYTVFLTWKPKDKEKLNNVWCASDGLAWIGNFADYKQKFMDDYKQTDLSELWNYARKD